MKQAMNFRLSKHAALTLSILEHELHLSKTSIVEQALELYAQEKIKAKNSLLKFAGCFNGKEAEKMLENIKASRHNKNIQADL